MYYKIKGNTNQNEELTSKSHDGTARKRRRKQWKINSEEEKNQKNKKNQNKGKTNKELVLTLVPKHAKKADKISSHSGREKEDSETEEKRINQNQEFASESIVTQKIASEKNRNNIHLESEIKLNHRKENNNVERKRKETREQDDNSMKKNRSLYSDKKRVVKPKITNIDIIKNKTIVRYGENQKEKKLIKCTRLLRKRTTPSTAVVNKKKRTF